MRMFGKTFFILLVLVLLIRVTCFHIHQSQLLLQYLWDSQQPGDLSMPPLGLNLTFGSTIEINQLQILYQDLVLLQTMINNPLLMSHH